MDLRLKIASGSTKRASSLVSKILSHLAICLFVSTFTPVTLADGKLPWRSGVSCSGDNYDAIEAWRGAPVDVVVIWLQHDNWKEIRNPDYYGYISGRSHIDKQLSIAIATLPGDGSGNYRECAQGVYDNYYRDIGAKLQSLGRGDSIIRLGWEANGDWYGWSIGDTAPQDYIHCFRKQTSALKSQAPEIKVEWPMANGSSLDRSISEYYPGDEYVDIVGLSYYDLWPAITNETIWRNDYHLTERGGPRGIGAWLDFARAHEKKLAISEWGATDTKMEGHGGDNPFYIEKMVEFFQTNSEHIAYESYFNCVHDNPDHYMIYPAIHNPLASAAYQLKYREIIGR